MAQNPFWNVPWHIEKTTQEFGARYASQTDLALNFVSAA